MPAKRDLIASIPDAAAVREALDEAKNRVSALEFLLGIAEGVEQRLNGECLLGETAVPAGQIIVTGTSGLVSRQQMGAG